MTINFPKLVNRSANLKKFSVLVFTGLITGSSSVVLAASPNGIADPALTGDGTGGGLFSKYIIPFTNFLAAAVGLIVVISIIYGAIEYSSAGGDPNKAAKARNRIQKAIVSLIVFFFLYAILQWIVPGGIGG